MIMGQVRLPKTVPICTCDGCKCVAAKTIAEIDKEDKLMQFLMGLGDNYGHIRDQILIQDPLPNANKAYSTLLRVKKQ